MVFTDNIDKEIVLEMYLWSHLSEELRSRENRIVRSFLSNLEPKTKIK